MSAHTRELKGVRVSQVELLCAQQEFLPLETARSILIPDGEDELALRVLRCLAEIPHFKLSVLSRTPWAPIRFSRHRHQFVTHRVDGFDRERIEAIKKAAQQIRADIILPTGLPGIRFVAEHKEELVKIAQVPPISSKQSIDLFADKVSFAEILEREGIPYPKILRLQSVPVDEAQLESVTFPALVKPRNLEAGNGIRLCESPRQIVEYLADQPDPGNFFIQEFISGPDIDCSVLSDDGEILAYTIQRGIVRSQKPFRPPAAIEFVHNQGIFESVKRLVRAVRWSGVVNFDLVLDQETNETKMLEANPRYWRSLLGSLTAGVNFPYLACLASEGRRIPLPEYQNIRYAKADLALSLILKSWSGNASKIPTFTESGLYYLVRDPLPEMAIQLHRFLQR